MTLPILENLKPDLNRLWPTADEAAWRFVLTTAAGDNRSDAKVTVFAFNKPRQPLAALKTSLTGDDTWVKNQYATLQLLESLNLRDILYPRPIAMLDHDPHRFYLESYVAVRPTVYRGKQLQSMTRWAVEWLTDLHCMTRASDAATAQDLQDRLATWLSTVENARCLKPDVVGAARDIVAMAQAATSALPTVLMHGDFHPNQFLLMPKTRQVGIVDWEHATRQGWPLLDLIELLATGAYLGGAYSSATQACHSLFVRAKPQADVSAFLDYYCTRLGVLQDWLKWLLGVYALYALARVIALRGDILPLPAITDRCALLVSVRDWVKA